MPSASAANLDAVTVDAFGTIVELLDPVDRLRRALEARGVACERDAVARAFAAEADYYIRNSIRGRDEASLAELRRDCVDVFLADLGAALDPAEFVPAYIDALEFRAIAGVEDTLDALRRAGLALACVGNWDCTLPSVLARLGLAERFEVVVASAVAGVQKPHPAIFALALDRLGGVPPERALHVGDSASDRDGARAAGLAFEPVPLVTLPERLGL
jgi:putative hydrolase of the HAD superfamily